MKYCTVFPDEGQVTVYNVGTKADGEFEDIRGTAVAPNPATPAKLIVTFPRGRSSFLSDP
jgi:lipocalin